MIKEWLLKLWEKILQKYAESQLVKLKKDFQEIFFEYQFYKKTHNMLLLLWILQNKPLVKVIYATKDCYVLEVLIGDKFVQLPLTEYLTVISDILGCKIPKGQIKEITSKDENLSKIHKFLLQQVIKSNEQD